MSEKLLEQTVRAAHLCVLGQGAQENARSILKNPEASATAVFCAAKRLLGGAFVLWEPESIWRELGTVVTINRDKLMAAVALATTPSFYWNPRVLGATTLALNNEAVFPQIFPHTTPEQLAWGCLEAELLFAITDGTSTTPEYDVEAEAYVAAMLHDAGWVHTPSDLSFAQETLSSMLSPEGRELAAKVKRAWEAHPKAVSEDTALGVQLTHLARTQEYVRHRLEQLKQDVAF